MTSPLDEMIASLEAKLPPEQPLTEEDRRRIAELDLSSCDFCGGGCSDPECWRCYSPLSSENLHTLAENLSTAGTLCRAWQLFVDDPTWYPGCNLKNEIKSPLVRVTRPRHYEGAIFCLDHLRELSVPQLRVTQFSPDVVAFWGHRCLMCGVDPVPGRHCENEECRRPLHPQWPAVYCSNDCALGDQ